MNFPMVPPAYRHGELIAYLAGHRTALGKAQMVGVRGSATANKTSLLGNEFDVLAITNAPRLR
jgi:hypothetical protein